MSTDPKKKTHMPSIPPPRKNLRKQPKRER
jgi:hypothetical protein